MMKCAKNSWLHLAFRSAGLFGQSGGSLANRNALPLSLLAVLLGGGMLAFRYWKNKRDWR